MLSFLQCIPVLFVTRHTEKIVGYNLHKNKVFNTTISNALLCSWTEWWGRVLKVKERKNHQAQGITYAPPCPPPNSLRNAELSTSHFSWLLWKRNRPSLRRYLFTVGLCPPPNVSSVRGQKLVLFIPESPAPRNLEQGLALHIFSINICQVHKCQGSYKSNLVPRIMRTYSSYSLKIFQNWKTLI